jgi:hypothetical protein
MCHTTWSATSLSPALHLIAMLPLPARCCSLNAATGTRLPSPCAVTNSTEGVALVLPPLLPLLLSAFLPSWLPSSDSISETTLAGRMLIPIRVSFFESAMACNHTHDNGVPDASMQKCCIDKTCHAVCALLAHNPTLGQEIEMPQQVAAGRGTA